MNLNLSTKSLKFRAMGVVAAILLVVITALTAALTYGFTKSYTEAFMGKTFVTGEQFAEDLSKSLNLGLPLDSLSGVNEKCQEILQGNKNLGYCIVTDPGGKVLFSNEASLVGTEMKDSVSQDAAKAEKEYYHAFRYKEGDYYDTVVPLKDAEGKHVGALRLGLGYAELHANTRSLLLKSVLVGFASLLLAILAFTAFITYFITNPITYLVGVATQIAKGDLTKTIEV